MNAIANANAAVALKSVIAKASQQASSGSALDMADELARLDGFLDADGFFTQSDEEFAAEIGGLSGVLMMELEAA